MSVREDIQKLEPGGLVELWQLDASVVGIPEIVYFHAHRQTEPIWFDGIDYAAWPIEATGFELTGDQPPTPKLTVGNINGSITALCLQFDDMLGAKLTRIQTFVKYLDAVNFPSGNPDADPAEQMPQEIWYVERKTGESVEAVEFELSSALDLEGIELPRRVILASRCNAIACGGYRGPDCGYTGPAVATIDDVPTSDPLLDRCSGTITGCKLRFGENGELPYGGFPAAGLLRT